MKAFRVPAPAKTNLVLRILKKRKDGFHDLCSLFQRISFCDELVIQEKRSSGLSLTSTNKALPKGKNNLIHKAYNLMTDQLGTKPGLSVRLIKRIPTGAGLGGGSSDAASMMLAMNELFQLRLKPKPLSQLGLQIGSDVPFFLQDTSLAIVEGQGEKLKVVPAYKSNLFFLVASFKKSFSTKEMYALLDEYRSQPVFLTKVRADVRITNYLLKSGHLSRARQYLVNDFSPIAEIKLKSIEKLFMRWRKKKIPFFLSGSGSSVIAVFDSENLARKEKRELQTLYRFRLNLANPYKESIAAQIKEELGP